MDVSIIIINYNTKNLTKQCLNSVLEKTVGLDFDIFVVDNNSQDGSVEMLEKDFPQVKLIKNPKNSGFGAANNIAIKQSDAKYVFLLNSDTILLNNAIKIFFDFMENPENLQVGNCGGLLYNEDLSYQYSYGDFPSVEHIFFKRLYLDKIFKSYYCKKFNPGKYEEPSANTEVGYIAGASIFFRKSALDEAGLFDEDFFLYYEETELNYRIKKKTYKTMLLPEAKIIHLGQGSSEKSAKTINIIKKSEQMFFEKCYGKKQKNLVKIIQILGELPRFLVNIVRIGKKTPDNNINVLHLISSFQVGGLEKLLIDLLKNQYPSNIDFTVVVINNKINEDLKKELLETKYKVYFLNRKEGHKHPRYLFELFNIIKENKIDIIHSHTYGSKMWSILCKVFNPKIKTIYTVHDTNIISKLNKINFLLHKFFVDMNIAISNAVFNECIQNSLTKVITVYDGIDTKKYFPKKTEFMEDRILKIINIARINHKKKGQDVLINALKECKDKGLKFQCNLVGTIHNYTEDDRATYIYLKNLVKELNLENEIQFLGTRNDIPELLSKSDLFILPSRYEGLGLVILEAMASKVPVIVSNIDGPAELIKQGENGLLFESENANDLAETIKYLYEKKTVIKELTENAYKFVQDFDISVMNEKYFDVYNKLIEGKQ